MGLAAARGSNKAASFPLLPLTTSNLPSSDQSAACTPSTPSPIESSEFAESEAIGFMSTTDDRLFCRHVDDHRSGAVADAKETVNRLVRCNAFHNPIRANVDGRSGSANRLRSLVAAEHGKIPQFQLQHCDEHSSVGYGTNPVIATGRGQKVVFEWKHAEIRYSRTVCADHIDLVANPLATRIYRKHAKLSTSNGFSELSENESLYLRLR